MIMDEIVHVDSRAFTTKPNYDEHVLFENFSAFHAARFPWF